VASGRTAEQRILAMVEAASLELGPALADQAEAAGEHDPRLGQDRLRRTARLAVAAWALALSGDHSVLTNVGPAEALYWLLHPVGEPWQVAPGPVVTHIVVWGLDAEASPPEFNLSFDFSGHRRYDDRPDEAGDGPDPTLFRGIFTMTLSGRPSLPWQLSHAHVETMDDYYGYVYTSRAETAEEFRVRTGSAADPVRDGPLRTYRLVTGFAEHDVKFGSSAAIDVLRDAPPGREDAAGLLAPAIDAELTRALGPGDWRPSMNWLDVVELLAEPGSARPAARPAPPG
jgi:hypothetical protein